MKNKNVCVIFCAILLLTLNFLPSVPTLASSQRAEEIPIQGLYIKLETSELQKAEKNKIVAQVLKSDEFKILRQELIHKGFTPKLDDASVARVVNNGMESFHISVPFNPSPKQELKKALVVVVIKENKIVEASYGIGIREPTRFFVEFSLLVKGDLKRGFIEILLIDEIERITLNWEGKEYITILPRISPVLEHPTIERHWWGWKIIFSNAETHIILRILRTVGTYASALLIILVMSGIGGPAGVITGVVSFICLVGFTYILWVNTCGGYKGIYVGVVGRHYWWCTYWVFGAWVWHN